MRRSLRPVTGPPRDATSGLFVLIVDDNERNLKLARDVLSAAGFRTLEGSSGREAVELAERHLPDVILLDLGLPDMHGTAVVRKLAEEPRTTRIPVVAFTATPLAGAAWFLDAGFAGYLEKPFDVTRLAEQVRGFCEARFEG